MASQDWNGRITSYLQKTGVPTGNASDAIEMIGAACQAAVENLIGRTLDNRDYSEAYTGTGREILFLQHDPIVSLTAVSIYGTTYSLQQPTAAPTYPPADVFVNRTRDGLARSSGDVWPSEIPNGVLVAYTAGLTDPETSQPPADLMFAITFWAATLFRRRDRLGESSATIAGQTTTFTSDDIPAVSKTLIERYRRPFLPC